MLGWAELLGSNDRVVETHLSVAVEVEALGPIRGTVLDLFTKLAVEHDRRRALRLGSNAPAQRDGGRPPAWLRRMAAITRARAEQQLDPPGARRAWDQGSAMTTEATIAFTLGRQ
jgi:hypothetical protein